MVRIELLEGRPAEHTAELIACVTDAAPAHQRRPARLGRLLHRTSTMLLRSDWQWNLLFLITLVAGTLFIAATRVRSEPRAALPRAETAINTTPAPAQNHPAPNFTLPSLTGAPVQLSELHGSVVLINVWATWCPPCRAEMPAIQAVYEQYRDQGFTVLAVNVREDPQTVGTYMAQHGLSFPALLDADGAVASLYRSTVYPSSYFIDRAGVVRAVYRGPMNRAVIAGTVEQLLAEGP